MRVSNYACLGIQKTCIEQRSSYKERIVDALAIGAEEGRD